MSFEAHIESLVKKHGQLEDKLRVELRRPQMQEETVAELKRRKLRLKDQITKLKAETTL